MTHKSQITHSTSPFFVTGLPSKTHTTANIDATRLIYLMVYKQSCVTAMIINAVIQARLQCSTYPQSFFTTHSRPQHHLLKLLSMKRCNSFCHSVIMVLFSYSTILNFHP